MDDDAVWAAIDSQRVRTADMLEGLTDAQWAHPSLCDGWTVRDVAAHLTLQQVSLGEAVVTAMRHPGSLNRMIRNSARGRADVPVEQLIAEIRAMVGSRRHNVGVTSREALMDILVHGQDIAIPLHLDLEMPTAAAAVAATTAWSYRGKGKARVFHNIPVRGFRFKAIDLSWSVGQGPEIEGPISAILLLLTGRLAGLPRLTGEGIELLHRQLRTHRSRKRASPRRPWRLGVMSRPRSGPSPGDVGTRAHGACVTWRGRVERRRDTEAPT